MLRTVQRFVRDPIRDAAILVLAVGCAFARALPLVYFPTVVHEGKGPVYFHYPVLGFALALVVGWRRPFRSLLLFGIVHLGAVLAFEWYAGVYDTVLGGRITPHVYLVIANLYFIAALAVLAICTALLVTGRRVPIPVLPDRLILLGLFALAFVARWWWGRHVLAGGNYLIASDDGVTYHALARGIAQGTLPRVDDYYAFGGKLYWYFLAAIYRVAGLDNFSAVIFIQAALGALVPVASYMIAKAVTGSQSAAAIVGLLTALNKILIFLSGVMGMEALYLPLLFTGLAWLICQPRRLWAYAGIGLVLGLANLARNEIFAYPFLLLVLTVLFAHRDRVAIRGLVLVCLGFVLTMVGEMGLTYLGYGRFTLPSGQAAITFSLKWYGLQENYLLDLMGFNPFRDLGGSLAVWASHFSTVTHLLVVGFVKRLGLYLFMPGDGLFDLLTITDSDFIHNYFPAVNVSFPALLDSYALLFCVIGLFSLRRYRREQAWALLTFVVYVTVLNAAIIAKNPRHRAALIPIFVLATVQGFASLIRRVRSDGDTAQPDVVPLLAPSRPELRA